MARGRISSLRPGALILAFLIACFLWAVSQGQADIEQVLEIPVELHGIPEALVLTEQNADSLRIHVGGTAAALRNIEKDELSYRVDLSSSTRDITTINVENPPVSLPRGVRTTQLSPSQLTIKLERKARKSVTVRPDLEGEPAEGFRLKDLRVVPTRVWLAGAQSQVLKLDEVVTQPIVLTDLSESEDREVRLYLGGGSIWKEEETPVRVVIEIEAVEPDPEVDAPVAEETG